MKKEKLHIVIVENLEYWLTNEIKMRIFNHMPTR